ncbi:ATP-binding protein [Desulforhopalus singaporensis]|nr:ATP-binding protein [Desulforhopalus singaporensis]
MARAIVGADYHDHIRDKNSITEDAYLQILNSYSKICVECDFQYLWSNLFLEDGTIVFTTGTPTRRGATKGNHANFFDIHSDPKAFDQVKNSGEISFTTFHNEWGSGRMVLVPFQDSLGRMYVFGASMSLKDLDDQLQASAMKILTIFLLISIAITFLAYRLAKAITRPIKAISKMTETIASGKYGATIDDVSGCSELKLLTKNINIMSNAIFTRNNELQTIVESLPLMVFLKDAKALRYIYLNHSGEKYLGMSREEVIGKNNYDLFEKDQADLFTQKDREAFSSHQLVTVSEEPVNTPHGKRLLQTRKVAITDVDGKPLYLLGLSLDITEQKKAELELRRNRRQIEKLVKERTTAFLSAEKQLDESLQKYRVLFESTADAVMLHENGVIVDCNKAALKMFGCKTSEDLKNRNPSAFSPPFQEGGIPSADLVANYTQRATEQGNVLFEWNARRLDDGKEFPCEVLLSFAQFKDRMFIQSVVRDITVRKKIKNELIRAKEAADAASQAKSEFLANMSHEIRTPMNGILGMTYLALQTDLNDKQRNYIFKANKSAENLLAILNDILDYSRMKSGKLEIQSSRFLLHQMLDSLVNIENLKTEENNINLTVEVDSGVPEKLTGDSLRLRQVLTNLITNAIKFSDPGGKVSLHVSIQEDRGKEVLLHFVVQDRGIGISPDQQEAIFHSFSQTDGSSTRRYGGTGLGLSISKKIVQLMHGNIWVKSELGVGSTFHFTVLLGKVVA